MSGVWRERLRFFNDLGFHLVCRHRQGIYPALRLARLPDEGRRFVSFGPVT
jgi:hypothetical protein